ncbi:SDR family NAD(P)-dependent oxidoreductase [Streptomyces roseirectus]|uniref:SDR family NAD(P)-dependent oxidoreductase n=1 Tax=Streptomyces roseirectus TaxID=2768066 RepID=A0A7H0IPX1_9ACTN|nr:type I polyketide synthase [Streptomyces roseirectus]QNP74837.1 SDR family NAD(P)-dependent oxidoreductase [Streptomyces roseirectus]
MSHDQIRRLLNQVTGELRSARDELRKIREPVAIVGIGCRFPGGIGSPEDLWRLVATGGETLGGFPDDRGWNLDRLRLADAEAGGPPFAERGGFLSTATEFDAGFFGVSDREALAMDPQHRLLLEVSWEAVERAGVNPSTLAGRRAGVFTGLVHDHGTSLFDAPAALDGFLGLGSSGSLASGRVAYVLGTEGPAVTVDTACSSSLVALHLAVRSLRSGECDVALAGGATVMSSPTTFVEFSRQRGLAPDGRCKAFGAGADGTGFGEGVGVLVLERLSDAMRAGHRVWAVIRGSALNQDGASNGLTAPSGPAQQRMIRDALSDADLTAQDVDVVEAHGTGTALGDPIEAQALLAAYGQGRSTPLYLGSVKSNIGHTLAAAGVAGVIKMVMALEHGELPRTLHADEPSPHVDWSSGAVELLTEHVPWPVTGAPRRAGVSSFGVSGTNAHVILEAAPEPAEPAATAEPAPVPGVLPWILSAEGEAALRGQADALADWVSSRDPVSPAAVARALVTDRALLRDRAVVLGASTGDLVRGLRDGAAVVGRPVPGDTCWLFTGQGAQRPGAGRELAARFPLFASSLREVCAELAPHMDGDPYARMLTGAPGALDRTEHAQPAVFALQVAMARLLESWGMAPDAVAGHSVGEIAAAHVAGVLSLPDAARLVTARASAMGALPEAGAMVAVEATEAEALAVLDDRVALAAVNGPRSVVLSGDERAVLAAAGAFAASGRRTRRLRVSHAFHSPLMVPMLAPFRSALVSLTVGRAAVPVVSTLTGDVADPDSFGSPDHWLRHVTAPVRFLDAVGTLEGLGVRTFLELGPDAVLAAMAQESARRDDVLGVPLLRRGRPEESAFLTGVAQVHVRGGHVDWAALLPPAPRAELPTYAFRRRRYWLGGGSPTSPAAPSTPSAREPAAREPADLLGMVLRHCAAVLTGTDDGSVDPDRAFSEAGLTSMGAVELRNRLAAATGLRLDASLVFDHPTPAALARFLEGGPAGAGEARAGLPARGVPSDEPLAIVGIGCRFPGGVATPGQLWDVVSEGRDVIGGFPRDRGWDLADLFDDDPDRPGRTYAREGGFLDGPGLFDPGFFGIGPREALGMDPQQRLLLEVSWEAVESAGIDPASLRGSRTGVYTGIALLDYADDPAAVPDELQGYATTGGAASVASGRVAYALGLEGPALTVDTACSSSLVALHLAGQALRGGECDLALVGGATVMCSPKAFIEFSRQRGLAPDGRCKAFGAGADGVGWGEGAGVLAVERLSDARRHGRRIFGIVRGSAVNQDGASNGLTAPSGPAQQRVIRDALADAGLEPGDVDAVEAHGTGTTLGDPIEAQALLATYGQGRSTPLYLGSVKSNIGHTQAAAGVAGVVKTLMAFAHGVLPRTLHAEVPSPHVDWARGSVELLTENTVWPRAGRPWRAGVSSFGVSGTNAHVILEAPPRPDGAARTGPDAVSPLVLSAHSAAALTEQARQLAARWDDFAPAELAHTLAATRTSLPHRAVVVTGARDGLVALADGTPTEDVIHGGAARPGGLAFLFTGQGAQRAGMAGRWYEAYPVFARALDEICSHFPHLGLREALLTDTTPVDDTAIAQPALFAVEVALFRLLSSWGVRPTHLAGHSIGEVAAAHVAGVLSLADACLLVGERGRLMAAMPDGGAMVAVRATEDEVRALLAGHEDQVSVAAVNGPDAVVLSGTGTVLAPLVAELRARSRRTRPLRVSHAFHSPHVDAVLDEFRAVAERIDYQVPRLPLVSGVTGTLADPADLCTPDYWVGQLRAAVRFHDAVRTLRAEGVDAFLELGPDTVLAASAADCLATDDDPAGPADVPVVAVARRGRPEVRTLLTALAHLYVHGRPVDWTAVTPGGRTVDLPPYPFQRRRYWLAPGRRTEQTEQSAVGHALLTAAIDMPESLVLTGRLTSATAWLDDHVVFGGVVVPGAAVLDLALTAGRAVGCPAVEELTVEAPLTVPAELRIVVTAPDEAGRRPIEVHARPEAPDADWVRHATGLLHDVAPTAAPATVWPPPGAAALDTGGLYDLLAERGFDYGPAFRGLTAAWRRGDEVFAELTLPGVAGTAPGGGLHPAMVDAAQHALALLDDSGTDGRVPFSWHGVSAAHREAGRARVRVARVSDDTVTLTVWDESGAVLLSVDALTLRALPPAPADAVPGALYEVGWAPVSAAPAVSTDGVTVLAVPSGPSVVDAARTATELVLAALQDPGPGDAPLVIVTRGALSVEGEEITDVAAASVWGLVRSAQTEQPGRFVLVDTDGDVTGILATALATGEPQLAVRAGRLFAPRLRTVAPDPGPTPPDLPGDGTVLVTGGTGGIGSVIVGRLLEWGVPHITVLARRATDLGLGPRVRVLACDVGDRERLATVIGGLGRRVSGVVHAAGVSADGVIGSLNPERLREVMRPKADAAWWLHELTLADRPDLFVLFSSSAGVFGSPGQANYAAANAFLDALARHRAALGLPAQSLAWGTWEQRTGVTAHVTEGDLARMARSGMLTLDTDAALRLFGQALSSRRPVLAPMRFDAGAARRSGFDASVLRELVGAPTRRTAGAQPPDALPLRRSLATAAPPERHRMIAAEVRRHVAFVLGYDELPDSDERELNELGLDSLTAVELRNRLGTATGLRLPATLAFDHPSVARIAEFVAAELEPSADAPAEVVLDGIEDLGRVLDALDVSAAARTRVTAHLQALLARWQGEHAGTATGDVRDGLADADEQEVFAFIDAEFGSPSA